MSSWCSMLAPARRRPGVATRPTSAPSVPLEGRWGSPLPRVVLPRPQHKGNLLDRRCHRAAGRRRFLMPLLADPKAIRHSSVSTSTHQWPPRRSAGGALRQAQRAPTRCPRLVGARRAGRRSQRCPRRERHQLGRPGTRSATGAYGQTASHGVDSRPGTDHALCRCICRMLILGELLPSINDPWGLRRPDPAPVGTIGRIEEGPT
jgi:hypothetical protein